MRSILTALFNPLNISMLVVSAAAGLCSAWWLFPLGVVLWIVMVVRVATDPNTRLAQEMKSRAAVASRFQAQFNRIERAQVSLVGSLSSSSSAMQRALLPIRDEMDRVVDQAYSLCSRMTALENYRAVRAGATNFEIELARIDARIAETTDPRVKQEYEETKRSTQARLTALQAIASLSERVETQLSGLAAEMDGVLAEVLRLQSLKPEQAATGVTPVVRILHDQAEQLPQYEKEVMQLAV
ncbi:MAG: hypothetical protein AAB427_03755 [Chloroflexota bacterium]